MGRGGVQPDDDVRVGGGARQGHVPTCTGAGCFMYVGDFQHTASDVGNLSLSIAELNTIDTGGHGTVYLGDRIKASANTGTALADST